MSANKLYHTLKGVRLERSKLPCGGFKWFAPSPQAVRILEDTIGSLAPAGGLFKYILRLLFEVLCIQLYSL